MNPIHFHRGALLRIISGGIFFLCAIAFLCLLPGPRAAQGQNMPLDDKARYERSLEVKVEEVLLKLLGPNQAKVVVQATMDFTRTEKVNMTAQAAKPAVKREAPPAEPRLAPALPLPEPPAEEEANFPPLPPPAKEQKAPQAQKAPAFQLPGFPAEEDEGSQEAPAPAEAQKSPALQLPGFPAEEDEGSAMPPPSQNSAAMQLPGFPAEEDEDSPMSQAALTSEKPPKSMASQLPGFPAVEEEQAQVSPKYPLPGFSAVKEEAPPAAPIAPVAGLPAMADEPAQPESSTYQKEMLYPVSFIKKLVVTVVLNKDLPEKEAQAVRSVVSEILSMDLKRGDELVIIRTPFAPVWRTILNTPEAINLVFKYIILTVMGVIALIVVAVGFLKLAGAMNTMAKVQQSHQITMDLGKSMGMPAGPEGIGFAGPADVPDTPPGEKEETDEHPEAEDGRMVFNVRLDQLFFLVELMNNEDPANVALVATHLPPEVRNRFLGMLPVETASGIISHMAKVRFVDPDIISTIKDELERRLSGASGGLQEVIEVLQQVGLRAKRDLLKKLMQNDPETARAVRRKIFLPEDLWLLSDRDMSLVIGNFKVETLSAAIWDFPQTMKDKIQTQMAEKTWKMVEQTLKYRTPTRESSEKATEELIESVLKLIKEGQITNPLESETPLLVGPEAKAAGSIRRDELSMAVSGAPKPDSFMYVPAKKA